MWHGSKTHIWKTVTEPFLTIWTPLLKSRANKTWFRLYSQPKRYEGHPKQGIDVSVRSELSPSPKEGGLKNQAYEFRVRWKSPSPSRMFGLVSGRGWSVRDRWLLPEPPGGCLRISSLGAVAHRAAMRLPRLWVIFLFRDLLNGEFLFYYAEGLIRNRNALLGVERVEVLRCLCGEIWLRSRRNGIRYGIADVPGKWIANDYQRKPRHRERYTLSFFKVWFSHTVIFLR